MSNLEAGRYKLQAGLFSEFWYFLRTNKRWWLLPMMVGLRLLAALVLLSATASAPAIYTRF